MRTRTGSREKYGPHCSCLTDIRNIYDVSMLDGNNAPMEALPDIEGEGSDKPMSQVHQY